MVLFQLCGVYFYFADPEPIPVLDVVPEHYAAATSSPISSYAVHLEGVYSRTFVSSGDKFPPNPSKTYVNLEMVEHGSNNSELEKARFNVLNGRIDATFKGNLELGDILKPQENGSPVSLVFVEGPPGIGKSTLAWELCRRWDRKQYDLAVLLRLREREVQQMKTDVDLFDHVDKKLQKSVAEEVRDKQGNRVLFILDGYDELGNNKLVRQNLLFKLLTGEVFSKCSVLITSRPSASGDFLMNFSSHVQRRIEILGFSRESIRHYISTVFSSDAERGMLHDFETYVSASENVILSLMYVPINAVILIVIYRANRKNGSRAPIPKTQTQIYTCLCLTLLQRHLDSVNPQNTTRLNRFRDLPDFHYICLDSVNPQNTTRLNRFRDLPDFHYICLKALSRLAFEQFEERKIVFSSDCIKFTHFGFLDSVPASYSGDGTSYNFLHLTLQEFLAAYHISELPNRMEIFDRYCNDKRWEVVWTFFSGLTKFQFFTSSVKRSVFTSVSEGYVEVKNLLLHCLYEGEFNLDFKRVFGEKSLYYHHSYSSPLDRYVLGHCIAYSSPTTSWHVHVQMWGGSDESFEWGLTSNHSDCGIVSELEMYHCHPTCLNSYPKRILEHITRLRITIDDDDIILYSLNLLLQVIPSMTHLALLCLDLPPCLSSSNEDNIVPKLLRVISCSNVTALTLKYRSDSNLSDPGFLSSLHGLTKPSSQLKDLTIEPTCLLEVAELNIDKSIPLPLCECLFRPSSLNRLTLKLPYFTEKSFDRLETNTCLIMVHIFGKNLWFPPAIVWQSNKNKIEDLRWGHCQYNDMELQYIKDSDTQLKRFDILVHGFPRAFCMV